MQALAGASVHPSVYLNTQPHPAQHGAVPSGKRCACLSKSSPIDLDALILPPIFA
jgi:hypothetical protein